VHSVRVETAVPNGHERPDEGPHHLMQEGVRPRRDLDAVTDPSDRQPLQPPHRPARLRPPAERREVVLTDERSRSAPHRRHRELTRAMPNESGLEWVRPRPRVDPISILASGRREPSIEPLRSLTHVFGDNFGAKQAVDRSLEAFEIDIVVRDERRHLPPCVHTRVGPPRYRELRRVTQDARDGVRQDALDGALTCVPRPPSEPRPVVRKRYPDDHVTSMTRGLGPVTARGEGAASGASREPEVPEDPAKHSETRSPRQPPTSARLANRDPYSDPTSSIRAIGAPSPCRCPSLRIRV